MRKICTAGAMAAMIAISGNVQADETGFLASIHGNFNGTGFARLRTNRAPINVDCDLVSKSTVSSLSLSGTCRGLVLVTRHIEANLTASGSGYRGTYIGAGSGPAQLSGRRVGNAIVLDVLWAKDVNGDRSAKMRIDKIGSDGLKLTTIDQDPTSGKSVVTSQIDLKQD